MLESYDMVDELRKMKRRPSMHPHAKHRTKAGPAQHVLIGKRDGLIRGRVYVGMRKYGYVDIVVPDVDMLLKQLGIETNLRLGDRNHARVVAALGKYRIARYAREIQNVIMTAWRC